MRWLCIHGGLTVVGGLGGAGLTNRWRSRCGQQAAAASVRPTGLAATPVVNTIDTPGLANGLGGMESDIFGRIGLASRLSGPGPGSGEPAATAWASLRAQCPQYGRPLRFLDLADAVHWPVQVLRLHGRGN